MTIYDVDGHRNREKLTKSEVCVQTLDCSCASEHNTLRGLSYIWVVCSHDGGVIVGRVNVLTLAVVAK